MWIGVTLMFLSAAPPSPEAAKESAQAFLAALKGHRWDDALARCDPKMKAALQAQPLEQIWQGFEAQVGPLDAYGLLRAEPKDAYQVVTTEADFKQARRQLKVTVNAEGEIAGLFWGASPGSLEPKARKLVDQLSKGDFEGAEKGFGPKLWRALPKEKLAEAWKQVTAQAGSLEGVGAVSFEPVGGEYTIAWVACRFAKGPMRVKAVYDLRERLEGLFFLPGEAVPWSPAPYAKADAFDERPVVVKVAGVDLPGFLTLPKGDGPFPAVVLVHGSGPSDADESVGAVKVFKDLAQGLSSRGVLVLRYTKRTRASAAPVATVEDEVIDAVHEAVKLLQGVKQVDPKRITVAGHSQGGYLAPRIAKEVKGLRSIVMLSAPARSVDALLDEQLEYLSRGADPLDRAALLEKQKRFKEQIHSPQLKASDDVPFPVGGSSKGSYYLDLRAYEPVKTSAALPLPVLLIQGGRDYQVSAARDFGLYQQALAGKPNAVLQLLPALNHLLVPGAGESTPAEYEQPGHVDPAVIEAIAAFATARSAKAP